MNADTIFINGRIYQNNSEETYASTMAIKDGRIVYIGDLDGSKEYCNSIDTKVYDLKGKNVLPGMIDCHIHPPGNMLYEIFDISLYGKTTKEEVLQEIRDYIDAHPDNEYYYGSGFHLALFSDDQDAGKGPNKKYLDEICSDKPIIIHSEDMHNLWANSKAFEIAGVTSDTPDPAGGRIERDDAGEPWGIMREEAAMMLMPEQKFTVEEKIQALEAFQRRMNSWGYTGMISLSGIVDVTDALEQMSREGTLKLRTTAAYYLSPASETDLTAEEQLEIAEKWRSEWSSNPDLFKVSTIKIAMDGVVEGVTAGLIEQYTEKAGKGSGYHGELEFTDDELAEICFESNRRGFQVHVHSIGDLSTNKTLDAFAKARECGAIGDYRNVITHLQVVKKEDIQRFKELDVIAATQPFWHFKEPGLYDNYEEAFLGRDRAEKEYPLRSFVDAGVTITASSDHGVTPVPYPFFAIETGVTRNMTYSERIGYPPISDEDDERFLLNKDERISVKEMFRAYTTNAAYQSFREKDVGSLEEGKFADFIVVDQNIFEVNHLDIEKTNVLMTVFAGEIVFENK